MAEREEDKDVSRHYRELPHEEPPPALDAKIRARARAGRRGWYFPVAAAAVIMLAVAVTTQVEREQPKEVTVLEEKPEIAEVKPQRPAQADSLARREDFSRDNRARQERPAASPPVAGAAAPAAAPAAPPAASAEAETRRLQAELRPKEKAADSVAEASAEAKLRKAEPSLQQAPGARGSGALSSAAPQFQTPEAWLTHIATLRAAGNHDEADKSLAEFRKRYPDYKIPPAMLEKVEKR